MLITETDQKAINLLVDRGNTLQANPALPVAFTNDPVIDNYLNDLNDYPHFFVLAIVMDRQIKAEKAWKIPYFISKAIGKTDFKSFAGITPEKIEEIFEENHLHPYNRVMAGYFYKAVQKIKYEYRNDASYIWRDNYSCDIVLQRFLEFEGVCTSSATLAVDILVKEFRIPMINKSCVDIAPDAAIRRVFTRIGFIEKNSTKREIIDCARELNPDFPGIFDLPVQEISQEWCRSNNPDCANCYLSLYCKKKNIRSLSEMGKANKVTAQ